MAIEITIPRLGWSMEEGTFSAWLKAHGELIKAGDMVYVLEGEKAAQEIESFDAGTLCIPGDAPKPGDTVKVGQVIGYLLAEGESPPSSVGSSANLAQAPAPMEMVSRQEGKKPARSEGIPVGQLQGGLQGSSGPAARRQARHVSAVGTSTASTTMVGVQPIATPRARRRAKEIGLDWKHVSGTGRHGRIRERDVVDFAARSTSPLKGEVNPIAPGSHQPASKIRRMIAQRMQDGFHQAVPVTLTTTVDASALVAFRNRLKAELPGRPVLSYTDMIVKLAAKALPHCPALNACWHQGGVYLYHDIHIAVAVDTESGLIAPVIRSADKLSLQEIAERSRDLIHQARAGTLSQSQLLGGTFTVTSLGMYDVDFFTPILNLPQSGILGLGRIVRQPVVRGDAIAVGEVLNLSLTFDHRVLDGAPAARWLQHLSRLIKEPGEVLKG
ncbi:MAG: dihydrolipoamide acetyltransferase family protein [Bdellovibrionales bacterium]